MARQWLLKVRDDIADLGTLARDWAQAQEHSQLGSRYLDHVLPLLPSSIINQTSIKTTSEEWLLIRSQPALIVETIIASKWFL